MFTLSKKFIFILMVMVSATSLASTYTVTYDATSPIQSLPLKNTAFDVAVFADGNPQGRYVVITNSQQQFMLTDHYTSSITVKIIGARAAISHNIKCQGIALPGNNKISLVCTPIKE